jgi:hypothetical protein
MIAIRHGGGGQLPWLVPSLRGHFLQSSPRTILRRESQNNQEDKGKEGHHCSRSKKVVKDQGERTGTWYPAVYTTDEVK